MWRLDDIDRRVIMALQSDGRKSYSQIGTELGISQSVVRYRVQRLEESGVLQIVGIANPLKIGFDHMALIGVRVRPGTVRQVCEQICEFEETSYVVMVAGSYDIHVEVVCRDGRHFTEFLIEKLQAIEGVVSTESLFVLGLYKLAYGWGVGGGGSDDDQGAVSGPPAVAPPINRSGPHPQALGVL
ncbi:MAG: Lrp/AsnC family transcriptional regulator [Actinomycetota bacterium]|jgi:Lrp/AsnC family transcriptional regulator for asnA, asnC and gidA|nr:Lrp/AsnC family transcriptional regulator [Actinomycetota bacterium]